MLLLVALAAVYGSGAAIDVCSRTTRTEVKWYYDNLSRMCFATRVDCVMRGGISLMGRILYDSEEWCTLENMQMRWITFSLRCPSDKRMAVYSRSNGDFVPFLFDARQCKGDPSDSDICDWDESCFTSTYFGWCCKRVPFQGEGPNEGSFRFTGYGGAGYHIQNSVVVLPPPLPPYNCNQAGPREAVEWFASSSSVGCLSQRLSCSTPAFSQALQQRTFPTQQQCVDHHYPTFTFTYHFNCAKDDAIAVDRSSGTPLVFSPQLCAGQHNSDMCNLNEYCTSSSTIASCCRIGGGTPSHMRFVVAGNQYRKSQQLATSPLRKTIEN